MEWRVIPWTLILAGLGGTGAPRLSKLALAPTVLPADFENPNPVTITFDSLANILLTQEGFTVVPASETDAIWKRLVDSVHGYYDPIYGKIVPAKYDAVAAGSLTELRSKFHIDGWVRGWIERVPVWWSGKHAEWDGHSEGTDGGYGTTEGLSLVVSVVDTLGKELYHGRGGIQQSVRFLGYQPVPLPREQLLTDGKRNDKAVHLALDSLVAWGPHAQR